jgi:hypothetical protein
VFECSIRDFFECQNIVEACWFEAFFTQFCLVFECQKFRHVEFLMLELAFLCLSAQSVRAKALVTFDVVSNIAIRSFCYTLLRALLRLPP